MNTNERTRADERPLSQDILYAARYYLGGRTGLLVLIGAVVVAGMVTNWSWLVAIGVAPLLIMLAPCAVMCALGLCASRTRGQSCASPSTAEEGEPPIRPAAGIRSASLRSAASEPTPTRRKRSAAGSPAAGKSTVEPQATRRKARSAAAMPVDAKVAAIMPPVAVHDTGPGDPTEAGTVQFEDAVGRALRGASATAGNCDPVLPNGSEIGTERS